MVKRIINNKKFGFTLAEVLISMLIMSVFFVAFSKVITQKQPTEFQKSPHGYYECYLISSGGAVKQHGSDSLGKNYTSIGKCVFDPPQNVRIYNIHYVSYNSYYHFSQSMFNEPLNMSSPDEFITMFDPGYLEQLQGDIRVFYRYLENSYRSSDLYQYLNLHSQQGPASGLFIAW